VGSSKNNTLGLLESALAIVTLYYSPPESIFGK
jgi:hypothetical protein